MRAALLSTTLFAVPLVSFLNAGETNDAQLLAAAKDSERPVSERVVALDELAAKGKLAHKSLAEVAALMDDAAPRVRVAAAAAHWRIGGDPEPAVRTALDVLSLPIEKVDDRVAAVRALGAIGPPARKAALVLFAESMKTFKGAVINHAVTESRKALALVEPQLANVYLDVYDDPSDVVARLAEDDAPTHVPKDATWLRQRLVRMIADQKGDAVEPCMTALTNDRVDKRRGAALALRELRQFAAPARESLTRALEDDDDAVRATAAHALFRATGEFDEKSMAVLIRCLSLEPPIRSMASAALAEGGDASAPAIPALVGLLKDDEPCGAPSALAAIGAKALPSLIQTVEWKSGVARLHALTALAAIRCDVASAVKPVAAVLGGPDKPRRSAACRALANFGPQAASASPAVAEALSAGRIDLFDAAATLKAIGPDAAKSVPALLAAVADPKVDAGFDETAQAIKAISPETVPALVERLAVRLADSKASPAVADGLRRLGPEAKAALPALSELLREPESPAAAKALFEAAATFQAIGPDAASAVDLMIAVVAKNPAFVDFDPVVESIQGIAPERCQDLARALGGRLSDTQSRDEAFRALVDLQSDAVAAVDALRPFLTTKSNDRSDAQTLAAALSVARAMGPRAKILESEIVAVALGSRGGRYARNTSIRILKSIPRSDETMKRLRDAAKGNDEQAEAAQEVLTGLGETP